MFRFARWRVSALPRLDAHLEKLRTRKHVNAITRKPAVAALTMALCAAIISGCGLPKETKFTRLDPPIPAPDFTLPVLGGGEVTLSDLQGDIVIMEFWATWCGPCRFSTPSLDQIYRKHRKSGVTVLLINQAESVDTITEWVDGRFEAPILLDDGYFGGVYGATALPSLFVLNAQGEIVFMHKGYDPRSGGLEHNLNIVIQELQWNS